MKHRHREPPVDEDEHVANAIEWGNAAARLDLMLRRSAEGRPVTDFVRCYSTGQRLTFAPKPDEIAAVLKDFAEGVLVKAGEPT